MSSGSVGSFKSRDKLEESWGSHPSTASSRAQLSAGPTGLPCVYMNSQMVTSLAHRQAAVTSSAIQ